MKKKFFVLRSTSSSGPARLEYYDSEKKFHTRHLPKRSIHLHTCFNINRKSDSRHKNAIAMYTKEECFSVVCEDEKEQENWLSLMLEYQNEYVHDGERNREHYEYVWQVSVQPKGLGQTMNIRGSYRLCLTRNNVCLVKLNTDKPQYVFQLETVRSLAHNDSLFRMEVGKIAPTGEGEIWMQADDAVIAQNLHATILNFMKTMDRRFDLHDTRRSDSIHGSSSTLPRQSSEFRHRTSSETLTQGNTRNWPKVDRPASVYTGPTRSNSHLHNTVSPGTSPLTHSFVDHQIIGSHRLRSDSNESKASRSSTSGVTEDVMHDVHNLNLPGPSCDIMPLEEEEADFDISGNVDQRSIPSSPGSHLGDVDEYDGQGEGYLEMTPGSATPPTPGNSGYIDMAPLTHKDSKEGWTEQMSTSSASSSYVPMNPSWSSSPSAPIPIHPVHGDHSLGYMDMSTHNPLPPVKEGGSTEGYLPMSPSYSASPSGSSSQLRPDRVACMLSDDGNDYPQPPTRTYSLGSRPVKIGVMYTGYVDMSGRKGVSDNGRSCSAPHLINHHPHPHRNSSRNSTMDSPTPSASPLSISLRSDDSDSFMELDFYRPRTASDSYSYRPRASSFGMPQSCLGQGHRPRSSSHGQGTRPLRQHKILGMGVDSPGRLNHDILHRSLNSSSHGSFDSLRVSSSESLKKLSQEVRTKTSQLNSSGYMDMSFEKRHTPSPQPGSSASSRSGQNGYVDMTLGTRRSSPSRTQLGSRSNSKTSSTERLPESDYTDMSLGGGGKTSSSEKLPESNYTNMSLGGGGRTSSSEKLPESDYTNMSLGGGKSSSSEKLSESDWGWGWIRRGGGKSSSSEKLQESDYTNMSLGIGKMSSSEKGSESDYTNMSLGGGSSMTDSVHINFDSHEGASRKEVPTRSWSSENVDAYIMYEPAATSTSGVKSLTSKGNSAAFDTRNRSGSGGKDQKKRSFFSLRHSDSLKHSSKKTETSQHSGMFSYSSTGGKKFGSLGRDIRQKSKDSSKSGAQKSSSFSRTFGISTSKPGKLSRKTPTPPKSLDGNDEYIEFSPTAVRSDSDSSHSSGSSKSSRMRHEVTKQEAEYIGFEPGNIPVSSIQRANSSTSGYVPMNAGSQGSVFKPVKRSGTKRPKSKDESGSGVLASTPGGPMPVSGEESLAKPMPIYSTGHEHNSAPVSSWPLTVSSCAAPLTILTSVTAVNSSSTPMILQTGSVNISSAPVNNSTVSASNPAAQVSMSTTQVGMSTDGDASCTATFFSGPVSKSTTVVKTGFPAKAHQEGDGSIGRPTTAATSSSSLPSVSRSAVALPATTTSAVPSVMASSVLSSKASSSSSSASAGVSGQSWSLSASAVASGKTSSSSAPSRASASPASLPSPDSSMAMSNLSSSKSSTLVISKPSPLNTVDSGYMDFNPCQSSLVVESFSCVTTTTAATVKSYVSDGLTTMPVSTASDATEVQPIIKSYVTAGTRTAEVSAAMKSSVRSNSPSLASAYEMKPEVVKSYISDDVTQTQADSSDTGCARSRSPSSVTPISCPMRSGSLSPVKSASPEKGSSANKKCSSEKADTWSCDKSVSEKGNNSPFDNSSSEKSDTSTPDKSPPEKLNSFSWDKSILEKSNPLAGRLGSSAEMREAMAGQTVMVSPNSRSRKASGGVAGRSRRFSGDKMAPNNNSRITEPNSRDPSSEGVGSGAMFGSGVVAAGGKAKEVHSPRLSQGSQSPGSSQQGLTRPESTPCMLSMDKPSTSAAGRGRGRHCSSSSCTGGGQPRKGKNNSGNTTNGATIRDNNGNSRTDSGMLQINTETEARHSITDLSGYEQMSFPSNALSRQQPAHFHSRQQQPSLGSSQGSNSTGGSQGVLNYATLDLGSADSMGEGGEATRSPRNKNRHPSAAEEKGDLLSYATIDFEKSEILRNTGSKDPKLTL